MFKKRRIKKELDIAISEGDDAKIEQLIKENPWLQDYLDDISDDTDITLKRVCAAIGVMEDELGGPVGIDDIMHSIEHDLGTQIGRILLESTCLDLETKGYIKSQSGGYILTIEGGRICDKFLNRQVSGFLGDLQSN